MPCANFFRLKPGRQARTCFSLHADPIYLHRDPCSNNLIYVGTEDEILLHGPLLTYALNWLVPASQLPKADFCIYISGNQAKALARGLRLLGSRICILITYCRIDGQGNKILFKDGKRWQLVLKTDPFSKYLVVVYDEIKELPLWCNGCREEIER